ncbi:MAG TPA: hypothetical protein VEO53_12995 [Candidatus Binatia bacterium]|nr:hypothetical protein [Candidatus Binatia bacterium]
MFRRAKKPNSSVPVPPHIRALDPNLSPEERSLARGEAAQTAESWQLYMAELQTRREKQVDFELAKLKQEMREQPSPAPPTAPPQDERPSWMVHGMEARLFRGREDLEVVGESHYQDNLWQLVGGRRSPEQRIDVEICAVMVAEDDNPYDANAVAIWIDGLKVGHLSRDNARRYRPGLLALQEAQGMPIALPGVIVGGGMRDDGPGRLGVFLRHDAADFGLRRPPLAPPPESRMRTGLSDAAATDAADDAYDLSWMRKLPADEIRAIPVLRRLLADEKDLLGRHFMYARLEAVLYRSRGEFTSAPDEYRSGLPSARRRDGWHSGSLLG